MQAIIMAGGKGTRLSSVTNNQIPKAMVAICGKPLIQRAVEQLIQNGINDIIISVGYLGDQIVSFFSEKRYEHTNIRFIHENEPLGTAGALAYASRHIEEDFLFVYGDLLFDIDLERMYAYHSEKQAIATLFVHPNSHPYDSDLVCCDSDSRITGFQFKDENRSGDYDNLVNAGIMIFSPKILSFVQQPRKMALEKELLIDILNSGAEIYAYRSPEYIKDVGTKDRFQIAEREYSSGKIEARNLRRKQKAIFLDRDGTINQYVGLVTQPEQLMLIDGAIEAIHLINQSDYLAIVVTNQPVVARGDCTVEQVEDIHKHLYTLLGNEGVYVDDLAFCPHHPDKGFPGENLFYKTDCQCRKPKPGMILEMAEKYNIDLACSWMIGDTERDVMTGINAGTKTALVNSEATEEKMDASPDLHCNSLLFAVETILKMDEDG